MWLFGEMWKALKWSHGMTRPGYVGWRRFCAAWALHTESDYERNRCAGW